MRIRKQLSLIGALVALLGALMFVGAPGILAQNEATPAATGGAAARPGHIHTGSCDNLGDVVAPLTDLTAPTGTASGQTDIDEVQYSFTTVPLALTDILAADHVINLHESSDQIQNYIACGNIGGTVDANGSLVISLRELNESGYSGIAVLTPNPADATATDISVFIHKETTAETEATPES